MSTQKLVKNAVLLSSLQGKDLRHQNILNFFKKNNPALEAPGCLM